MLLLLGDGTQVPVTELPGRGPWTFLVLQPERPGAAEARVTPDRGPVAPEAGPAAPALGSPGRAAPGSDPSVGSRLGGVARVLTRFGRAVVPDLRGRPGWGEPPGGPGFLDLVDDLDQVRTRAGLGRPVLVGLEELVPLALRAAADQPWAWRALVLARPGTSASPGASPSPPDPASPASPPTGGLDRLDLPALVLDADPASAAGTAALERLLGRLGEGPGWAGIAPDAPPR
jgi:pimeloyl-ACP methyl ester carboxylesterase